MQCREQKRESAKSKNSGDCFRTHKVHHFFFFLSNRRRTIRASKQKNKASLLHLWCRASVRPNKHKTNTTRVGSGSLCKGAHRRLKEGLRHLQPDEINTAPLQARNIESIHSPLQFGVYRFNYSFLLLLLLRG